MAYIDIDDKGYLIQVPEDLQFMITKRALGSISFHMEQATERIHYLEDVINGLNEEISNLRGTLEDAKDINPVDYND